MIKILNPTEYSNINQLRNNYFILWHTIYIYIYVYHRARRTVATRDGGHRRWDTTEGLIYSGKGMGMMEGGSNSITWIKVASKSGGAGWVGRGELANHCHVSQCV